MCVRERVCVCVRKIVSVCVYVGEREREREREEAGLRRGSARLKGELQVAIPS